MQILVTNDDGYFSKGIAALTEIAKKYGEVTIVAPDKGQSGMGHAITINAPIMLDEVEPIHGCRTYKTSGTPVDCVKLAVDKIFHRHPDICLSGINHGSNSSINVIYSGTMSAAVEASIEGIQAVGFSLLDYNSHADFSTSQIVVEKVLQQIISNPLPPDTLLNVNIPKVAAQDLQGLRICRQAKAKWEEEYIEREDPRGRKYYWMTGEFHNSDAGMDTDEWALKNNYASICPVQFDLTAHTAIPILNSRWDLCL